MKFYSALLPVLVSFHVVNADGDIQQILKALVDKLKLEALELARETERLYQTDRCDGEKQAQCKRSNYHSCFSYLPSSTCFLEDDLGLPECTCGHSLDEKTSVVSIPSEVVADPSRIINKDVAEAICFSRGLDQFWADRREASRQFWSEFGVTPPQSYFGVSGSYVWWWTLLVFYSHCFPVKDRCLSFISR